MILIRDVFHCKFGRGDEMIAVLRQIFDRNAGPDGPVKSARILTDAGGTFFTVTSELVMESIDAHQNLLKQSFETNEFAEGFARMMEVVDSGHREYLNIVAEYK